MTNVRMERIALLWRTVRNERWSKVFALSWGIRSIRVPAEERSFLEGVYTVRRSEKYEGDESEKKL